MISRFCSALKFFTFIRFNRFSQLTKGLTIKNSKMSSWDNRPGDYYAPVDQLDYRNDYKRTLQDNFDATVNSGRDEDYSTSSTSSSARPLVIGQGSPGSFRVRLDVRQFEPDEVSVVHDHNMIAIHGKHEERSPEHGFISREFTRRCEIPPDADTTSLTCSWHPNHVLVVKAPLKEDTNNENHYLY